MERIFTSRDGHIEVTFFSTGLHVGREPRQLTGWRENAGGEREHVHWKDSRWVSDTEVNSARVAARTF